MGTFDDNLMFFEGTRDISAHLSSSALTVYDTPIKGMGIRVSYPSCTDATYTANEKLFGSKLGVTYSLLAQNIATAVPVAGADHFLQIPHLEGKWYLKLELENSAGSLGKAIAGIVLGEGGDTDRSVDWSL